MHGETKQDAPGSFGVLRKDGSQGRQDRRHNARGQYDGRRTQRERPQGISGPLGARKSRAWRRRIDRATMWKSGVGVEPVARVLGTRPYRRDWRPGLIGEG